MRILVCVQQIYDPRLALTVLGRQVLPVEDKPIYDISEGSRAALEWALALNRQSGASVTALAVGGRSMEGSLRVCLALGINEAVLLEFREDADSDAWTAAGHVAQLVKERAIDLVLCGDGVLGAFLAEGLGWSLVTRAADLVAQAERLRAVRLLERGDRQEVCLSLPAVVTVHPAGIAKTYVSRLRLQQAAGLPIEHIPCLDTRALPGFEVVEVSEPRPRPRRMSAPSAGMTAAQRMSFLMRGGQSKAASTENRLIEGDPEQAAEKIVQFLKERGFL
jgi:electron transfer flavoprotein alpha/beta subunit